MRATSAGWRDLRQNKMATGNQRTFYVSIFTFCLILSAAERAAKQQRRAAAGAV